MTIFLLCTKLRLDQIPIIRWTRSTVLFLWVSLLPWISKDPACLGSTVFHTWEGSADDSYISCWFQFLGFWLPCGVLGHALGSIPSTDRGGEGMGGWGNPHDWDWGFLKLLIRRESTETFYKSEPGQQGWEMDLDKKTGTQGSLNPNRNANTHTYTHLFQMGQDVRIC